MKENYQIYLPYQFHWRAHLPLGEPQLPHKKYVKKSKTDFDFFPDKINFGQNFFKDKPQITASNGSCPHRENIRIAKGFIAIDSYT